MTEVLDPPSPPEISTMNEVILSPWEIYTRTIAHDRLESMGIRTPNAQQTVKFENGLRYSASGKVLPVGWSAYEVEEGEFPEFESLVATAEAFLLMMRASDEPEDQVFRGSPISLPDAARLRIDEFLTQASSDIALISRHAPEALE